MPCSASRSRYAVVFCSCSAPTCWKHFVVYFLPFSCSDVPVFPFGLRFSLPHPLHRLSPCVSPCVYLPHSSSSTPQVTIKCCHLLPFFCSSCPHLLSLLSWNVFIALCPHSLTSPSPCASCWCCYLPTTSSILTRSWSWKVMLSRRSWQHWKMTWCSLTISSWT